MNIIGQTVFLFCLCAAIAATAFPARALAEFSGKYYTEEDVVIPPRYAYAAPFSQGFAAVSERNRCDIGDCYFITPEGAFAFTKKRFLGKPQNVVFQEAKSFSEGLAAVKLDASYGYINTQGEMIIEPQFRDAFPFENGKALVSLGWDGPWFFIDASGQKIVSLGEYVDKPHFDGNPFFEPYGKPVFADGRACFYQREPESRKKLYGFMNEQGEAIIPPSYSSAIAFSE
ncbi:MAG: WG repeat-containing protein [Deltaproteobacteria bacterium]|jgi:hypothetical protein|nr:WG repeat-containing protein [Deltaproteobacteria bacterium]